jgi:hypothetical protein
LPDSAGCTPGCTDPAPDANLDLLAALVSILTPEQRQRFAALLTGQGAAAPQRPGEPTEGDKP